MSRWSIREVKDCRNIELDEVIEEYISIDLNTQ